MFFGVGVDEGALENVLGVPDALGNGTFFAPGSEIKKSEIQKIKHKTAKNQKFRKWNFKNSENQKMFRERRSTDLQARRAIPGVSARIVYGRLSGEE